MSIYDKASLVLIPSGTKTSKVYSQKPTNGDGDFTFSRSTAATRVNASGNIEKETSNLLLQSNSFNTTWSNTNSSETGGQSGYDGTSNAWKLTISGAGGFIKQNLITSSVQTYSVYAKADTYNFLSLGIGGGTFSQAFFDLQNGTIGTTTNIIDATIQSVGSGWYRCSVTFSKTTTNRIIYPCVADNDYTGTSGSIFIQNSQSENGLVARDYIETTTTAIYGGITDNVPRLDYTDSSCPALLLEPQRTNLLAQSELFSGWSTIQNATITNNNLSSPEGVQNATKITDNATSGNHRVFQSVTTSATSHTFSIFLKKGTMTTAFLRFNSGSDIATANVDLDAGTITATAGSAVIEDFGNDWYRCSITGTAVAGTSYVYVYMKQLSGYSGSGQDMYLYGAQVEAGSYATSYIPTYGSAVTRNVDDCDALSATSLIGQSEGTLFLDFIANDEDGLQIIYQVRTTGSSNVGQIDFRIQSGNLRALGNDAGTTQFNISAAAAVAGTRYKCAVRYKNNDVAFYVNGVLKGSDTSASFLSSSLDQITFNENGTTFYPSVNVNQALIIPTALTNTELADLTTL